MVIKPVTFAKELGPYTNLNSTFGRRTIAPRLPLPLKFDSNGK